MPNFTINQWNGGISSHYHTGDATQSANLENISVTAHPDAVMIANMQENQVETQWKITCGFYLGEFIKSGNVWMVFATDNGEIFYNNNKIQHDGWRVYRACFYDSYTENSVKKSWIFLLHNSWIDRMEYDAWANNFVAYKANVDGFNPEATAEKCPILRANANVFIGVGNRVIVWDGVIFQKKLKFSDITKVIWLTQYGDYVHIYATDGESSYKWIYDPINDEGNPSSMKIFPRMNMLSVVTNGNTDITVTDSDDIYESSGLQTQKYLSYTKVSMVPSRQYTNVIATHEDTIYISGNNAIYVLNSGNIGMSPVLEKLTLNGIVTFMYATKNCLYIGKNENWKNIFAKISVIPWEKIADSWTIETLWYRASKYGKISWVNIRSKMNNGNIKILCRRWLEEDWKNLCNFTKNIFVQEAERWVLTNAIGNFHEIQLKIILEKSSDWKSPFIYSVNIEYDDTNTATI